MCHFWYPSPNGVPLHMVSDLHSPHCHFAALSLQPRWQGRLLSWWGRRSCFLLPSPAPPHCWGLSGSSATQHFWWLLRTHTQADAPLGDRRGGQVSSAFEGFLSYTETPLS